MVLKFVYNHENVVFPGPPRVEKTHLAVALRLQAMYSYIPVYYLSSVKLVQTMKKDYDLSRIQDSTANAMT